MSTYRVVGFIRFIVGFRIFSRVFCHLCLGLSRKAVGGGENKTGASSSGSGGGRTKADKLAAAGEGSRHITDFFPIRFDKRKNLQLCY